MSSPRDGVCLIRMGARLAAIGGINGPAYLNTAEVYDPKTDKWDFLAKMQTCRAALGVAIVPRKFD